MRFSGSINPSLFFCKRFFCLVHYRRIFYLDASTGTMKILIVSIFICFVYQVAGQQAVDTIEAQYPGGPGAWARYLNKNMRIPLDSNSIYSRVTLNFRVSAEGNISNVQMVYGDSSLTNHFVELMLKSGRWVPAELNKRPIPSIKSIFIIYCARGD